MMENSFWNQYHQDQSIREVLSNLYQTEIHLDESDEAELYAVLKRHLTKKELKLFVMNEANVEKSEIEQMLNISDDHYDQAKHKTYSKLKSNKIQNSVREIAKKNNKTV